jgi:hypothetical protein
VPVTVKVKSALPGVTQLGLIDVIVGFLPIVMTRVAVEVLQGLVPLLTVIVTLYVPAVVGVPEMTFWLDPPPCDNPAGSPVTV